MLKLIEALQILAKYANKDDEYPTNCEHDILRVYADIDIENVTEEDIIKLEILGFDWDDDYECFYSTKYGSC